MTRAQGLATTTVGAAVVLYKFISKQSHSEYYRAAIRAIRSYSMFSKTRENSKKKDAVCPVCAKNGNVVFRGEEQQKYSRRKGDDYRAVSVRQNWPSALHFMIGVLAPSFLLKASKLRIRCGDCGLILVYRKRERERCRQASPKKEARKVLYLRSREWS